MPTAALVQHPADRLLDALDRAGAPVSVGLDPVAERLPSDAFAGDSSKVDAIRRFSMGVLDAIEPFVACVKVQSACFERYGWPGLSAMQDVVAAARSKGMQVIYDAKRGDIGISAEHYAAASAAMAADWTTVSPYLGADGIAPFLHVAPNARDGGRGAFALVRTSNPGGDALQSLRLADGRTIAEAVADLVVAAGAASVGARGYSALGAVVGATKKADAETLRSRMPAQIFLVPGYGAQGGGVDDVLPCFRPDGTGAIVTASRSVLYPDDPAMKGPRWADAVRRAAERFRDEIAAALGR